MVKRADNNRAEGENQDVAPSLTALSHEVKELVRLISTTDISELHLESGSVSITIKRNGQLAGSAHANSVHNTPAALPETESARIMGLIGHSPAHGGEIVPGEDEQVIVAPLLGTFYAAPAPNAEPYIKEGDPVEPGQIIGIIEAMKMMNPIPAEVSGHVTRILIENAQPVEYGQPLMLVQTT